MVRFMPGFIAAVVAFVAAKLAAWVGPLALEFLVFLVTYGIVATLVDKSMRHYGDRRR